MNTFQSLLEAQRRYFDSGATRDYDFRRSRIERLLSVIEKHEDGVMLALKSDLRKPDFEAFLSEVGFIYDEIEWCLKNLRRWMKPKRVRTGLMYFPSSSYIHPEPLGQALIIGAWNYPFQLIFVPLIGALAAGNCAVLKPSELAPATAAVIEKIITEAFPSEYVAVVQGEGHVVVPQLLEHRFDHIFFTGSTAVGRYVAETAAKTLTPVTLELGGKSPCLVDRDCDLDVAARRIVWGKFFNAGQSCIAPDYVLVHHTVKESLLEKMRGTVAEFFGSDTAQNPDYTGIINVKHFDRLVKMLEGRTIVCGGQNNREKLWIAPTIVTDVTPSDPVMTEEIFGPILPILTYDHLDDAIALIRQKPWPLSLYVFTKDRNTEEKLLHAVPFGNGCVNDTLVHFVNSFLPFGGVGYSGTGTYHGFYSFEAFSRKKSIMRTPTWLDIPIRYQPYKNKIALIKKLFYS